MSDNDVVYFEINNWWEGEDYPNEEPFKTWMEEDIDDTFLSDEWAKQNGLCVMVSLYDLSFEFLVSSTRKWVEENCPCIFKYQKFLIKPNENGEAISRFGDKFMPYSKDNFGLRWI